MGQQWVLNVTYLVRHTVTTTRSYSLLPAFLCLPLPEICLVMVRGDKRGGTSRATIVRFGSVHRDKQASTVVSSSQCAILWCTGTWYSSSMICTRLAGVAMEPAIRLYKPAYAGTNSRTIVVTVEVVLETELLQCTGWTTFYLLQCPMLSRVQSNQSSACHSRTEIQTVAVRPKKKLAVCCWPSAAPARFETILAATLTINFLIASLS